MNRELVRHDWKETGNYPYGKWSVFVIDGKKLPRFGLMKKHHQILKSPKSGIWNGSACRSEFIRVDGTVHGHFITGIPQLDELDIAECFSNLAATAPFLSFDCQVYCDHDDAKYHKLLANDQSIFPILQFKVEDGKFGFTDIGKRIQVRSAFKKSMLQKPGRCKSNFFCEEHPYF